MARTNLATREAPFVCRQPPQPRTPHPLERRRRRNRGVDPLDRLVGDAARRHRRLAEQPQDRDRHPAALAPSDVPVLGTRADPVLQRRLHAQLRQGEAPGGDGAGRARLLAGDLADHLAADRRRHDARQGELERRPPGPDLPQRPHRGGVLDLRVLPGHRRRRRHRRHAGRLHRDHGARHRAAPPGDGARAARGDRGGDRSAGAGAQRRRRAGEREQRHPVRAAVRDRRLGAHAAPGGSRRHVARRRRDPLRRDVRSRAARARRLAATRRASCIRCRRGCPAGRGPNIRPRRSWRRCARRPATRPTASSSSASARACRSTTPTGIF